jgi:hypothetical protein
MTGTEIAIRAANAIEKATKKVETEPARESRRQAKSQGGTTVVAVTTAPTAVSVMPLHPNSPLAVPGSPNSSPHPRRGTRLV